MTDVSQLENWSLQTESFASQNVAKDSMLLRGGYFAGDSYLVCEVPVASLPFAFYDLTTTGFARSLEGLEYCALEVSTDGDTWDTIFSLFEGDDVPGSPAYSGETVSQVTRVDNGDVLLFRLALEHNNYWDFCYMNGFSLSGLHSHTTTTPTRTTTLFDPPIPDRLFAVNYEQTTDLSDWTDASSTSAPNSASNTAPTIEHDAEAGALAVKNGTAALEHAVSFNFGDYERLDIFAVLAAKDLGYLDCCVWFVRFEPSGVAEMVATILQEDGEDDHEAFLSVDGAYAEWGTSTGLTLLYSVTAIGNVTSACFIRAAGISGDVA